MSSGEKSAENSANVLDILLGEMIWATFGVVPTDTERDSVEVVAVLCCGFFTDCPELVHFSCHGRVKQVIATEAVGYDFTLEVPLVPMVRVDLLPGDISRAGKAVALCSA